MDIERKTERGPESLSERAERTLLEIGSQLIGSGAASHSLVHPGHDVNAYYALSEIKSICGDNLILHVQAYVGMSDRDKLRWCARLMDQKRFIQIRSSSESSIGNEQQAVVSPLFPNESMGCETEWNSTKITEKINQGLAEYAWPEAPNP